MQSPVPVASNIIAVNRIHIPSRKQRSICSDVEETRGGDVGERTCHFLQNSHADQTTDTQTRGAAIHLSSSHDPKSGYPSWKLRAGYTRNDCEVP